MIKDPKHGISSTLMMKTLLNLLILILFLPLHLLAENIGGYEVGQWQTASEDPTVQFKLTHSSTENCPKYVMEATLNASPEEVIIPIGDYANYAAMGMPRTYESLLLHHYDTESLQWIAGKQNPTPIALNHVPLSIVKLSLNIPWLPDTHYTLLLATVRNPETRVIYAPWILYDKENFDHISGSWLSKAPIPYYENFFGNFVQKSEYPSTLYDLYGSWQLEPIGENQTLIHYENYVDPGWMGRRFMGTIVQSTLQDMVKIIAVIRNHLP